MVYECKKCEKIFQSRGALNDHNRTKHFEGKKASMSKKKLKKIKLWGVSLIAVVGLMWLIISMISNQVILPVTTMQGHIEASPSSHVLKEPMEIAVHKHMLEHADGGNIPGAIINYNCEDYSCEEGLIEKLEEFAVTYPEHVYIAPFPNMGAKIVLTKLNQQKVLEEFNEDIIDRFVR